MPIPRRIFQIWYQGWHAASQDVRQRVEAAREHCRRASFEYVLEDDASIRRQLPPGQLATYLAYGRLHERVDFAKVCLLLARGGVYLDMDATLLRPLDGPGSPVVFESERLYVSRQHPALQALLHARTRQFVNNGFYAAPPGHWAVQGYVEHLAQLQQRHGQAAPPNIEATTGPLTLSSYLDDVAPRAADIVLVPWRRLEACLGAFCDADAIATGDALVVHRHQLTWLSPAERTFLQALGALVVCWRAALALLALVTCAWLLRRRLAGT